MEPWPYHSYEPVMLRSDFSINHRDFDLRARRLIETNYDLPRSLLYRIITRVARAPWSDSTTIRIMWRHLYNLDNRKADK
jgi:hypothetical protein